MFSVRGKCPAIKKASFEIFPAEVFFLWINLPGCSESKKLAPPSLWQCKCVERVSLGFSPFILYSWIAVQIHSYWRSPLETRLYFRYWGIPTYELRTHSAQYLKLKKDKGFRWESSVLKEVLKMLSCDYSVLNCSWQKSVYWVWNIIQTSWEYVSLLLFSTSDSVS